MVRGEERLEAIIDEYWDVACIFVGEDENLRVLLRKLGDSISRLWTAIDKGNPHRVALAALAAYRRLDDICRPLKEKEREALAEHEERITRTVAAMTAVTRCSAELRQKALGEYDSLLRQGRRKSYAKVQATKKYTISVRTLERLLAERADSGKLDKQRAAPDKPDELGF